MKLNDFIICDDVRTEVNNKVSLIGVYNDALNFIVPERSAALWPKAIRLGIFIRVYLESIEELQKIGKFVLEATINDKTVFNAEQVIVEKIQENNPLKRMTISVVFNHINIDNAGDMGLSLSIYDKNNELMERLNYPGNIKITEIIQKM